jgi:hypothetical protein
MSDVHKLDENWIHLGLGATAETLDPFTDMSWYADYSTKTASDGAEGRLVAMHSFTESWDVWEMHPVGAEVVLCTAGKMTLIQEVDGNERKVDLRPGEYAINAPGVWHTADLDGPATAVFITAGQGTEHRER